MNTRKIKWTTSNGIKEVEVQGCYPYLINQQAGKVVLDITTTTEDTTAADLEALADNPSGVIEEYNRTFDGETVGEWELMNTYTDYNSGLVDVHKTESNQYRVQVVRVDGIVKEQAQLRADIDFLSVWTDAPM